MTRIESLRSLKVFRSLFGILSLGVERSIVMMLCILGFAFCDLVMNSGVMSDRCELAVSGEA